MSDISLEIGAHIPISVTTRPKKVSRRVGRWKRAARGATHLTLDMKRGPTSFEVVAHASSAQVEDGQVALVDLVRW